MLSHCSLTFSYFGFWLKHISSSGLKVSHVLSDYVHVNIICMEMHLMFVDMHVDDDEERRTLVIPMPKEPLVSSSLRRNPRHSCTAVPKEVYGIHTNSKI